MKEVEKQKQDDEEEDDWASVPEQSPHQSKPSDSPAKPKMFD